MIYNNLKNTTPSERSHTQKTKYYDSIIYILVQEKLISDGNFKNSDFLGGRDKAEIGWERTQETFWEMIMPYISDLYRGLYCTDVCICLNSSNATFKIYVFHCF